jgi:hypothetical protein
MGRRPVLFENHGLIKTVNPQAKKLFLEEACKLANYYENK